MSYVLVVDDEEPLRNLLRRQLIGWGYSVRTASNANEALELMFAEPAAIAVIDLDLRVPGYDGLWLTDRIRETWTHTVVIIASGADEIDTVDVQRESEMYRTAKAASARCLLRSLGHALPLGLDGWGFKLLSNHPTD